MEEEMEFAVSAVSILTERIDAITLICVVIQKAN